MSYEGYEQFLCKNGHHWTEDCNFADLGGKCPYCKEEIVWTNSVNLTNGSYEENERIDGYIEIEEYIKDPSEFCICPTCGNEHIIKTAIYVIPKDKGRIVLEYEHHWKENQD